jgi:hypothetical protein
MQIALLEQRVARNAFDNEAWEMLVDELWAVRKHAGMQDKLKTTLETIVAQYPTAVRYSLVDARVHVDCRSNPRFTWHPLPLQTTCCSLNLVRNPTLSRNIQVSTSREDIFAPAPHLATNRSERNSKQQQFKRLSAMGGWLGCAVKQSAVQHCGCCESRCCPWQSPNACAGEVLADADGHAA